MTSCYCDANEIYFWAKTNGSAHFYLPKFMPLVSKNIELHRKIPVIYLITSALCGLALLFFFGWVLIKKFSGKVPQRENAIEQFLEGARKN